MVDVLQSLLGILQAKLLIIYLQAPGTARGFFSVFLLVSV